MKSLSIIIAYYSVNLNWITKLLQLLKNYDIRIYVYSKGKKLPVIKNIPDNVSQLKYVRRKNVGRNDETFLYHLASHYTILSDYLLFLKDSSLKDLHVGSRSISKKVKEIEYMMNKTKTSGYSCNPTDYTDGWEEDEDGLEFWTLDDWNPSHKQVTSNFIRAKPRGLYNWTKNRLSGVRNSSRILKHIKNPKTAKICYSGIFAVSKKRILQNNVKIYEQLLRGLQNGDNLEAGHYVERIWGILFK
tara:strand:- start:1115 stop:1849 length:735 start_codon:yes stop_codon:yes gene_type:complete